MKFPSDGYGNDTRIAPFDSPFALRFWKDERPLRTGFGYVRVY
jgi:hypothetical protein